MSQYRYFGKSSPIFAHLLLTNRCNLSCDYCFVDVNTIHKTDFTFEEWKQTIHDLRQRGCVSITFMGGEPLLFKEIHALIDYAKGLGLNVDMITNGISIEKHLDAVKKLDAVMISLDGDREAHDVNRGKHSFDHAYNALMFLKKHKIPVRINSMVTRQSQNSLPWMLAFAEEHNIPITFNFPSDFPLDKKSLENEIMLPRAEVEEYCRKLIDYKRRNPQNAWLVLFSEQTLQEVISYPLPYSEVIWRTENQEPKDTCLFGPTWIHVNSNGDVYPCSMLWNMPDKFKPKNIRQDGIDPALKASCNLNCKSCVWPAPKEWRRILTPKGMLDGAKLTLKQTFGQQRRRQEKPSHSASGFPDSDKMAVELEKK